MDPKWAANTAGCNDSLGWSHWRMAEEPPLDTVFPPCDRPPLRWGSSRVPDKPSRAPCAKSISCVATTLISKAVV